MLFGTPNLIRRAKHMAKVELKKPVVEEIKAALDGAKAAVVVDHRGLTVEQDTQFSNSRYRVCFFSSTLRRTYSFSYI